MESINMPATTGSWWLEQKVTPEPLVLAKMELFVPFTLFESFSDFPYLSVILAKYYCIDFLKLVALVLL